MHLATGVTAVGEHRLPARQPVRAAIEHLAHDINRAIAFMKAITQSMWPTRWYH